MSTEATAAVAAPPQGEVVASIAYVNGRRDHEVPIEEVGKHVDPRHGMVWIGLRNPSPERLADVVNQLGACDKNQEEMLESHRRPKIIDYGNMVLIVVITVEVEAERPIFGETQFLIGEGFLVTVRRGATAGHSPLRERLESSPDLLKRGSDYVASELLDWLVDRYVVAAGKIESVVEGAEQKLLIRGAKDADIVLVGEDLSERAVNAYACLQHRLAGLIEGGGAKIGKITHRPSPYSRERRPAPPGAPQPRCCYRRRSDRDCRTCIRGFPHPIPHGPHGCRQPPT